MITINHSKCNTCGTCAEICHEYCMQIIEGKLIINYTYCSTCTQCIAVCAQQALSWNNIEPDTFNTESLPQPYQMEELLKERRTNRFFRKEKVEKALLEEIAGYAMFAPTHSFNLRAVIIDDVKLIELIDQEIFKSARRIYKYFFKPGIIHWLIRFFAPGSEHEFLKAKPKLEASMKRNGNFRSMPPAMILIIGDKYTPLTLESAQYALYNIDLYARTKNLGCRNLVGNQMFLNKSKAFRKQIGLSKREKIFATLAVGYPSIKFRNKVNGKHLDIKWN